MGSLDTFPQDDSEDDAEVNYSFEEASSAPGCSNASSSTPPKAASLCKSKKEGDAPSSNSSRGEGTAATCKKGPQSEWKTAKGCLSNGAALGGAFDRLSSGNHYKNNLLC